VYRSLIGLLNCEIGESLGKIGFMLMRGKFNKTCVKITLMRRLETERGKEYLNLFKALVYESAIPQDFAYEFLKCLSSTSASKETRRMLDFHNKKCLLG